MVERRYSDAYQHDYQREQYEPDQISSDSANVRTSAQPRRITRPGSTAEAFCTHHAYHRIWSKDRPTHTQDELFQLFLHRLMTNVGFRIPGEAMNT